MSSQKKHLPRSLPKMCQESPWGLELSLPGKRNLAGCSRSSSLKAADSTWGWPGPCRCTSLDLLNLVQRNEKNSKNSLLQSSNWPLKMQKRFMWRTELGIEKFWKTSTAWCWGRSKKHTMNLSQKARNALYPEPVIRNSYLIRSSTSKLDHGDEKCLFA